MICPQCRKPMKEEKRSFHKQRKWICPQCGTVRMQKQRDRKIPRKNESYD